MGYNVAIDGPAGAGKSTIAKLVAKEIMTRHVRMPLSLQKKKDIFT